MDYSREAEVCRLEALSYLGKPEAPFLLNVARAFDELERRGDQLTNARKYALIGGDPHERGSVRYCGSKPSAEAALTGAHGAGTERREH